MTLIVRLVQLPIRAYRFVLSPLLSPSCRFAPSCSAYALEAIAVHGPMRGVALAVRRLLRCHPITWLGGSTGFDPVPPRDERAPGGGATQILDTSNSSFPSQHLTEMPTRESGFFGARPTKPGS